MRNAFLALAGLVVGSVLIGLRILIIHAASSVCQTGFIDRLGDSPLPKANFSGPDLHLIGLCVLMTIVGTMAASASSTVMILSRKRKVVCASEKPTGGKATDYVLAIKRV